MDNIQTALIIKELCKKQKVTISRMLLDTSIRKGLIYDMEKRDLTPSAEVLEKIADYFDCSVDYLLGRVDTPNGTYSITGDNNVQINGNKGNNFTINSGEQPKKENRQNNITENFIKVFETLDFTDQVEAMKFVTDMTKK